jgi:RNA polymerase sigma-70 factor, ECF subfamily
MVAVAVNGHPGAAAYRRDGDAVLRAFGIAVLEVTTTGIARIVVFGDPVWTMPQGARRNR